MRATLNQAADASQRGGNMPPRPARGQYLCTKLTRVVSLECVCGLLLVAITVLMTVQVFTRYVLQYPLTWSDEMVSLAFTWLSFLGAATALKHRGHIAVTYLVDLCPPRGRQLWIAAIGLAVTAFLCILTYAGLRMTIIVHDQLSAGLEVPMSLFYAALPVSGALMIYYELTQVLVAWKEARS